MGSWGGSNTGTCMRTYGTSGDCERGQSGTWRVGAEHGLLSIDDCSERCRRCNRCRWIAHSHAHRQCDWFNVCNTSKLRHMYGAETFKLRLIKPLETAA
uniref:Apple domain-containing protein n=1 Tax=Haptolina brevifila TaxID=156173 RepID=A0A7S2D7L8_9EUKA